MTVDLEARDARDLATLDHGWDPFSPETELWHSCPGHDWVRFEWPAGAHGQPELVTRCERCGAPRCDVYDVDGYRELDRGLTWLSLSDHAKQLYRCTLERHHGGDVCDGGHDYLSGSA